MRSHDYRDPLTADRGPKPRPRISVEADLVLEDSVSGFCGAVVGFESGIVSLEDRHGSTRAFPLDYPGFLLDGESVVLQPPAAAVRQPARSASGSRAVAAPARVAQAGRIYVEGIHDAELIEKVWGDDLRAEGIVVEPLHGIDDLPAIIEEFAPTAQRRLGVLVDHLVTGSKESRIISQISNPHVLVVGHPFIDIWQAVQPATVGIKQWPVIPKGQLWKAGVCAELGYPSERALWRHILNSVTTYADLDVSLVNAVERLIDFIFETAGAHLVR